MGLSEEDDLDQCILKNVKDYFCGSQNISLMRWAQEMRCICVNGQRRIRQYDNKFCEF